MAAPAVLEVRSFPPAPPLPVPEAAPAPLFTFGASVLGGIMEEPDITIRELALRTGRTERATWQAVRRLEEEGLLRRHRRGRRNSYVVDRIAVGRRLRAEGGPLLVAAWQAGALSAVPRHRVGRISG